MGGVNQDRDGRHPPRHEAASTAATRKIIAMYCMQLMGGSEAYHAANRVIEMAVITGNRDLLEDAATHFEKSASSWAAAEALVPSVRELWSGSDYDVDFDTLADDLGRARATMTSLASTLRSPVFSGKGDLQEALWGALDADVIVAGEEINFIEERQLSWAKMTSTSSTRVNA